jgi:hypothetical protein
MNSWLWSTSGSVLNLDDVCVVVVQSSPAARGDVSFYAHDLPVIRYRDVVNASKTVLGSQHNRRHLQSTSLDNAKDGLPPGLGPSADPTGQLVVPIATHTTGVLGQHLAIASTAPWVRSPWLPPAKPSDACADRHGKTLDMKVVPPSSDATDAGWGWTQPSGSSRVATAAKACPRTIRPVLKCSR